ncbi:MAG TPA: hypothetical protein VL460_04850 [Caulobacteraceae bacterium]|jgi:hypothetical protein|nr:hypothetical protein [Caulobacteraceae bacterium]
MILHGLSPETLARLLSLDRPGSDNESWLLFGPTEAFAVEPPEEAGPDATLRWAAE